MANNTRKDLEPMKLGSKNIEQGKTLEFLQEINENVIKKAEDAIKWYYISRRSKRKWAIRLRFLSIISGALAGILPLISQIMLNGDDKILIAPAWSTVALGFAGALIALDRFFGYSSGWVRYISAELRLLQLLDEFQIIWQEEKYRWNQATPDNEQIIKYLEIAKTTINEINAIIMKETSDWINEFQSTLKHIDELVESKLKNK